MLLTYYCLSSIPDSMPMQEVLCAYLQRSTEIPWTTTVSPQELSLIHPVPLTQCPGLPLQSHKTYTGTKKDLQRGDEAQQAESSPSVPHSWV